MNETRLTKMQYPSRARALLITGLLSALAGSLAGCAAVGFAAAVAEREGTHDVDAEYTRLDGKSYAVVVSADRSIQSDHPLVMEYLIDRVTDRLSQQTNVPRAGGYVRSIQVIKYLNEHPGWTGKPMSELAKDLGGVDRLIFIDLFEFRLNDPGNAYLWEGVASARISVIETDSPIPDDHAFTKTITVRFPDQQGMGPNEMQAVAVRTELSRRMVDRLSWLFYNHEEKRTPDY
ncbi:MAG: hypothetical protein ACOYN0_07955 [Phycisphaerales bacterium]